MFNRLIAFVSAAGLLVALATGPVSAQDKASDKMSPADSMDKMHGDQMNDQGKMNGKKKMKHKKGKMQDKSKIGDQMGNDKMGGKMADSAGDKMGK